MELLSLCFYVIVQTTLIGTVSYLIWRLICFVVGDQIMKYRYGFLKVQLVFWLVPIGMMLNFGKYYDFESATFRGTMMEAPLGHLPISVWIVLIWIAGCLCKLCKRWKEQQQFLNLMKINTYAEEETEIIAMDICEGLGLEFTMDISINPLLTTALTYRKRGMHIVLPAVKYTTEQLKMLLLHEAMHIKKKDLFFKRIVALMNISQWFNPIAMLYKRELFLWSEIDCDRRVYEEGIPMDAYLSFLLSVNQGMPPILEEAAFFLRSKPEVSKRVEALIKMLNGKHWKKLTAVVCGFVFVMLTTANAYAAGDLIEETRSDISAENVAVASEMINAGTDINLEYQEPLSTEGLLVVDMDSDVELYGDGYYSNVWNMPAGSYYSKSLGSLSNGDKVDVMVRAELGMHVGLAYNATHRYFVAGNDVSHHQFTVNWSGTHRIYVENTLDHEVEVTITVYY